MNKYQTKYGIALLFFLGMMTFSCSHCGNKKSSPDDVLQKDNYESMGTIEGVFDIPEITVAQSPDLAQSISLPGDEKIIDYDVSPAGPTVAILAKDKENNSKILFWQIGLKELTTGYTIPDGYDASSIVWHPKANAIFLLAKKENKYHILRLENGSKGWQYKSIFSSLKQLRRVVVCPRPFIVAGLYSDTLRREYFTYRLFVGMATNDHSFRIVSVTESGSRFYQVIGPAKSVTTFKDDDVIPSELSSDWALPIAFHPAGHQLIWEDSKHKFSVANYENHIWSKTKSMDIGIANVGTITPTPNGLGLLHWQKDKSGIGLYLLSRRKEGIQIPSYRFVSTPSSVPDGKGIVGLTNKNGQQTINYVPISVPMSDVVNAWMFAEGKEELTLLQKNCGLFRADDGEQLYSLYESENYSCGDYDRNTPTRPYMVTTDIFWELYGAAYEGLFMLKEREDAIPNFWNFISAADQYYKKANRKSAWTSVFSTLVALNSGGSDDPEVRKIQNAGESGYSDVLKHDYDYTELKPRSHYTSTPEMQKYFAAFKYFTTAFEKEPDIMGELNDLPKEIRSNALEWIKCYQGFIATSRSPLIWKGIKNDPPVYGEHKNDQQKLFPLSWGFDNEVLYSTVYHEDLPSDKQIKGASGLRLLPSGLDLASALGNEFADQLLQVDYEKFPPLRNVISNLKESFRTNRKSITNSDNLYDKWISALAVQWVDTLSSMNGKSDRVIWQTKRLLTGLSSWATLRHATGLVNERTVAECGEGGFEEILLRAPRGYVEPDPYSFATIADLFESTVDYVSERSAKSQDIHESYQEGKGSLYDGITKRLKEVAQNARDFQKIAEKERNGDEITNEEYEKIYFVARVAEHSFLIFKSLGNKDYALSTPDPISKIADVAGGGRIPFLMSAVGNSMEWDHIVPYYGRHQIVKGSIYSYFEFQSDQLLNDKEWIEKSKTQELLPWLKEFTIRKGTSFPAQTGY